MPLDCANLTRTSDSWKLNEFTQFCENLKVLRLKNNPSTNITQICTTESFDLENLRMLLVLFIMIGYGAMVRTILRITKCNIPYTVILMISGLLVGYLSRAVWCEGLYTYTAIARIPPKIILFTFLPVLIFESAFSITPHTFVRSMAQILIVALPGMVIATFLTAAVVQNFLIEYQWTFLESSLFGSIISATDPVAVVAILRELGTSEMLSVMVEGESLLNDGVAILLYEILLDIITCDVESHEILTFVLHKFAQITLGGPLFGFVMGKFAVWCLSLIFNDSTVEITITLVAAYLTYYVGEDILGVSGVMAVVVLGITMGSERTSISPEVENFVHHFWQMLSYLANTVLFIIVGIVITETAISNIDGIDWLYLIFLYVVLNIVRFLMLLILYPVISRMGYGLTWQNMIVMMWGGLRGAIGICLALDVYDNMDLCKLNLGPKYLFLTAGCVLLTLVINGTTTKALLDLLRLTEISSGRYQDMSNAMKQLETAQNRTISVLKYDRFVADANWTIVDKYTTIVNPYLNKKHFNEKDVPASHSLISIKEDYENHRTECPECHFIVPTEPNFQEYFEMTDEARLRVLKALKVSFWRQFEQGVLIELAVLQLVNVASAAEDKPLRLVHAHDLRRYWSIHGCLPWTKAKLVKTFGLENEILPPRPRNRFRSCCWWLATRDWFEYTMIIVIFLNMIPAIWETYLYLKYAQVQERVLFFFISVGFNCIYIFEFIVKLTGRGFWDYFCVHKLNYIDVITIILGLIDMFMYIIITFSVLDLNWGSNYFVFVKVVRVLRVIKLLKPVAPKFTRIMDGKINTKLFLGYDVGKGFVTAIDDVIKFMPIMVDHPKVHAKLKKALERERLDTVREMGIMQKDHPGIAIAVKTRHASRAVLNQMRTTLTELREDGLVDEKEGGLLMQKLEENMKRLWKTPPSIAPAPPEFLLANVPWIAGNKEIFRYIFANAELLSFGFGDIICGVGEPVTGIYIITSGMVKIRFVPTPETIRKLEEEGDIPNLELILDLSFRTKEEDFFSTGTVIGEKNLLTGGVRNAAVKCETSVFAFHISQEVMMTALKLFNSPYDSLESRMWRAVGMRLAVGVLPRHPTYTTWGLDRIRLHVEKSCVPIGAQFDVIEVEKFVSEVLVIQGKVKDAFSGEMFIAPILVPRNVSKLVMLHTPTLKARILVIAKEDFENLLNPEVVTELQKCLEAVMEVSKDIDTRSNISRKRSQQFQNGVRRKTQLNFIKGSANRIEKESKKKKYGWSSIRNALGKGEPGVAKEVVEILSQKSGSRLRSNSSS